MSIETASVEAASSSQPAASTPAVADPGPSSPSGSNAAPSPTPAPSSAAPDSGDMADDGVLDSEVNPPDFGLRPLREKKDAAKSTVQREKVKTPGFNVGAWDGDLAKLPADVRDFVEVLATRKYKAIEDEFRAKEDELFRAQQAQEKAAPGADAKVAELERELELYKLLAEGSEDPRVNDLTQKVTEWEGKYNALNTQFTQMQEESDRRWLSDFKSRHSEIFSDKAKSAQLLDFIEKGWEEDAAAQLVGGSEELVRTATDLVKQYNLGFDGHAFAIQHAKMKLGMNAAPRKPRPAAEITSGAQGQRNPSRVPGGSLRELPRHEARAEAARLALAVDNRRKA